MRPIQWLVVHCTATPQNTTVASIQHYWRTQLGWLNPGYHVVIEPNGTCHRLLPDTTPSNGVKNFNAHALHVSYIGGVDAQGRGLDTRTPQQKAELLRILQRWKQEHPNARIQGHRDFPNVHKECPCFNAKVEYATI
jgi:N-acetylmuramoyl-L-alanine amidase